MRVTIPDYDGDSPSGLVEREVPDELVQKFINWLVSANRYTYENNPEIVVDRAGRLRLALIAEARKGKVLAPETGGTAEITVKGLLALCDCETVEQLVDRVANAQEPNFAATAPTDYKPVVAESETGGA